VSASQSVASLSGRSMAWDDINPPPANELSNHNHVVGSAGGPPNAAQSSGRFDDPSITPARGGSPSVWSVRGLALGEQADYGVSDMEVQSGLRQRDRRQVRFCRDRFSATGELGCSGIRGAVGLGYRFTVQAYPYC
jgi:hypothetical protein